MQILLKDFKLNDQRRIALLFDYDIDTINLIKQIEGRKWSQSRKFWHIPYNKNDIKKLNIQFKGKLKFIRQKINPKFPPEYLETLKLKNYSEATIKTYRLHFLRFLAYLKENKNTTINQRKVKDYLLFLLKEKSYSTSAQNNVINALKLFFAEYLKTEIDETCFPRPRKEKTLPKTLSEQEVVSILRNINDLRIKCMTFFIYSSGLTPSEVSYLKISDIDSEEMKVFISSPKGKKDRYVFLSQKLINLLREYYKIYKPKYWLFESSPEKQFSKRTFQKVFKEAVDESEINKEATLTILKNSFTVHLLEKGVDVRFVQEILGHKSSKTTMKYLKVSKRDLNVIQSPLDNLGI